MNSMKPGSSLRGRGARGNIDHRFSLRTVEPAPGLEEAARPPATQVIPVQARSIITRNNSPDVGFNQSIK